jgi:quaternary ammonium compound-resistance protein SugE
MGWFLLLMAGMAEIIFAVSLKFNAGFTRLMPSIITGISGISSFYLLTLSLKFLPLGTAYAVWTGIGAVGVAIVGMLFFKESSEWLRVLSILFVIAGIVGLKFSHVE